MVGICCYCRIKAVIWQFIEIPCRASASDRIVVLCTRCLFVIIMLLLDTIAFIYQKACCIRAVQTFAYIGDLLLIKKSNSCKHICPKYNINMKYLFAFRNIRVRVMVFNATFNNISVISWWSTLLVKETGVSGENNPPVASH